VDQYHQTAFRRRPSPSFYHLADIVNAAVIFLLVLQIYQFNRSVNQLPEPPVYYNTDFSSAASVEEEKIKPWESKPPTPIALMDTKNMVIRQRHQCLQAVRERHLEIVGELLSSKEEASDTTVLLVDPAYHSNVGDHMLTLGELEFIQKSLRLPVPLQCHYVQAGFFYPTCTDVLEEYSSTDGQQKLALWHAGGNWGDLWRDAMDVHIPSF
jgi:hypothetical protein